VRGGCARGGNAKLCMHPAGKDWQDLPAVHAHDYDHPHGMNAVPMTLILPTAVVGGLELWRK